MSPWSPALSTSGSTGWFVSRTLGVCFNSGPTWHLWGVCSRFRIWVSNGDSYPLSGKANLVLCVCALWLALKSRVTFSTNQKQSRAKWWRNLVLRFSYKKCFRILPTIFFICSSGGSFRRSYEGKLLCLCYQPSALSILTIICHFRTETETGSS